jgi:hypothetical protein
MSTDGTGKYVRINPCAFKGLIQFSKKKYLCFGKTNKQTTTKTNALYV